MDATLVKNSPDNAPVRDIVRKVLVGKEKIVFNSFQNFIATDDQLAEEMLDELKLRGVDFAAKAKHDHLVLISEWDTFYARVLSLTYTVELAKRQGNVDSRAKLVDQYIKKSIQDPENLHSFVYVRGLDGQTVGHDLEATRSPVSEDPPRPAPPCWLISASGFLMPARLISARGPRMPTRRKARRSSTTSAAWANSSPP